MSIDVEGQPGAILLTLSDGDAAPVSGTGKGSFRYNASLNRLEYSQNGGGWTPFTAGGGNDSQLLTCPAAVNIGDAVAVTAADAVDQADADNAARRPAVGLVVSKPSATSCYVRYSGELAVFTGLTPGATYYVSTTPGAIQSTPPVGSDVLRQVVGSAINTTTLVVDIERDALQLAT